MKIVFFTSDENNGGIQQFMTQFVTTCNDLGHEVFCFLPNCKGKIIPAPMKDISIQYTKVKSLNPYNRTARHLAKSIESLAPDLIIMPEDAILSMQVILRINSTIKRAFVIHDVTPHPSNLSLKRRLTLRLCMLMRRIAIKKVNNIILLSENNVRRFKKKYPEYDFKIIKIPLGAHVPHCSEQLIPPEMENHNTWSNNFALFFGRIDKYKGIKQLLEAFNQIQENLFLVIAGGGRFSEEEMSLIDNNRQRIILINRFIDDKELVWLFTNCKFLVAPYTEASQSGVIPISYHFGKPVIASKIEGLDEYVIDYTTGILVTSVDEMKVAIREFFNIDLTEYRKNCIEYSLKQLNWKNNINYLIEKFK